MKGSRRKGLVELGNDDDDDDVEQEQESIAAARGGPIYVPNLISPLTSVPDFQASLLLQLQDLNAELLQQEEEGSSSLLHCNDNDLSVDELRIFSEEELVDMALKEAFKENSDDNSTKDASPPSSSQNGSHSGTVQKRRKVKKHAVDENGKDNISRDPSIPLHSSNQNESHSRTMRKKSKPKKHVVDDESYLMKVDELVKLKQKQDQDKAAVRLHSFNCKNNDHSIPSSDTIKKMQSLRSTSFGKQQLKSSEIHEHKAVRLPEVVLCVEIYHHKKRWIKTQEFLVLGRQILTEMRDKIYCLMDQLMQKAGQHDPSGYFLVEDVFCNDLRDASAIDYSEPIIDWLRNSKVDALRKWESIITGDLQQKQKAVVGELTTPSLPQFRRVDMHKTRFCDLRFRLGAGYLYCHQGDCKHTIVIRDMRLLHPDDVQNRAAYPIIIFQMKLRVQKCMICKIYRATKVTLDDKWAPDNPCYFCNDCYYLLHHSDDGSLLYSNFTVYDYVHD